MSINEQLEPMLTLNEVANLLHVHANTIRRWGNAGILKAYKINSRGDRLILKTDIDLFLASMNHNHAKKTSDV